MELEVCGIVVMIYMDDVKEGIDVFFSKCKLEFKGW